MHAGYAPRNRTVSEKRGRKFKKWKELQTKKVRRKELNPMMRGGKEKKKKRDGSCMKAQNTKNSRL